MPLRIRILAVVTLESRSDPIVFSCPEKTLTRYVVRRRSRSRLVERGALDLARLEDLEHVADLHVVEVREVEAALEAFLDLARVVLEALERVDRRRVDDGAVADDRGRSRRGG